MDALTVAGTIFKAIWKHKTIVLIAVLLGIIWYLKGTISDKQTDIDNHLKAIGSLNAKLEQASKDLDTANALVLKQNQSIQTYIDQAKSLQFQIDSLTMEYDIMDTALRKEIQVLRKRKPIPKECPGVMNWLRERAIEEATQANEVRT